MNVLFNILSFIPYFAISQYTGVDFGVIWLPYGFAQLIIGYVYFRYLPLKNIYAFKENEKIVILVMFLVLMIAFSSLCAYYSYTPNNSSWLWLMLSNATQKIVVIDSILSYLIVYVIEDLVKAAALYRNMMCSEKQKANRVVVILLAVVDVLAMVVGAFFLT